MVLRASDNSNHPYTQRRSFPTVGRRAFTTLLSLRSKTAPSTQTDNHRTSEITRPLGEVVSTDAIVQDSSSLSLSPGHDLQILRRLRWLPMSPVARCRDRRVGVRGHEPHVTTGDGGHDVLIAGPRINTAFSFKCFYLSVVARAGEDEIVWGEGDPRVDDDG